MTDEKLPDEIRKALNNTFKKSMGNNIKELRGKKGMTRKKLEEALKLKYSTISNYENGVRIPDLGTLDDLATYFGISIDELIGRVPLGIHNKNTLFQDLKKDPVLLEILTYCQQILPEDRIILKKLLQRMTQNTRPPLQ